jgi:hypothetical protein
MIDGRGHFQLKPRRFFIHGPHQDRMPFESDHLSAHSQLDKVQMHIYPITTLKEPVVKVIVMSSRCVLQYPLSIISSSPCIRRRFSDTALQFSTSHQPLLRPAIRIREDPSQRALLFCSFCSLCTGYVQRRGFKWCSWAGGSQVNDLDLFLLWFQSCFGGMGLFRSSERVSATAFRRGSPYWR